MKNLILFVTAAFLVTSCSTKDQKTVGKTNDNSVRGFSNSKLPPEDYRNIAFLSNRSTEAMKVIKMALDPEYAKSLGFEVNTNNRDFTLESKIVRPKSSGNPAEKPGASFKQFANIEWNTKIVLDDKGQVASLSAIAMGNYAKSVKSSDKKDVILKGKIRQITLAGVEGKSGFYKVSYRSVDETNMKVLGKMIWDHALDFQIKTDGTVESLKANQLDISGMTSSLTRVGGEGYNLKFEISSDSLVLKHDSCWSMAGRAGFLKELNSKKDSKPTTIDFSTGEVVVNGKVKLLVAACDEQGDEDLSLLLQN